MAQYVRFDYLQSAPDYKAIADKLIMQDLYVEVAKSMGVKIPVDDMKPFTITLDKAAFDPTNPGEYLKLAKK
jgi:nitrate/nitrite transport system substrate-binding protein